MEKTTAKSKKEAKDEKQKDQKIEEQIMKMLEEEAAGATPEEKFALLLRKHVESERGARKLRQEMKVQEKQLETVLREKENLQREYNKSVLMRDKLQEVCREQQKLIKSVKNESIQKIREEEERRKESQSKFQSSLNEITQSLTKNNDENLKLRDHNLEMTKKLKMLAEQYHMREQQLEKLNEQVQLESQLHQAKLNKVQVEAAMEKEILLKEKQIALEKFVHSQKLLRELTEREAALKEQLTLYTAKYDDFQNSLQKSNDIFATYKVELEKMAKNTRKLEKETLEWKTKWEKSNAILIELATEKKERDEHAARCSKQVEQLQKLLRALQNERSHLYKVLRENNVECPAMPPLPPEPEPIRTAPIATNSGGPSDKDKMEIMSRNCAELKQTLANLQSQMKYLNVATGVSTDSTGKVGGQTSAKQQQSEDSAKKRQRKKQKSKSNKNGKESSPGLGSESPNDNTNTTASVEQTEKEPIELPPQVETLSVDLTNTVSPSTNEDVHDEAAIVLVDEVNTTTAPKEGNTDQLDAVNWPETTVPAEIAAKVAELTIADVTEAAVATVAELTINGTDNALTIESQQEGELQQQQPLNEPVPN
ncbi:gamma-taxilin-like [Rhagoletis pomonella]|uniref:gamma-taxilin-like n=1 Tax=Rhagoletis pomonella TaxID=28610 RepID=UPI00177ADF16|nr:gamma-taxilin-like [Rhagoletis pomonella]